MKKRPRLAHLCIKKLQMTSDDRGLADARPAITLRPRRLPASPEQLVGGDRDRALARRGRGRLQPHGGPHRQEAQEVLSQLASLLRGSGHKVGTKSNFV